MISFATDDSREIKDLLSEIPKCKVNEFKGEQEHESNTLTEPNDSPFRVRRLSRSFSIPNVIKVNVEDEILLSTNDENKESEIFLSKSKFILLKRSRSLGNIFLPDLPKEKEKENVESNCEEVCDSVDSLTEKVEALEIEVLPEREKVSFDCRRRVVPHIDRPQTSPPILVKSETQKSMADEPINKLSILDRMQKSLGFFFRCARNEEDDNDKNIEDYKKYPLRSRTPDAKFEKKYKEKKVAVVSESEVPMQAVNFITKVDEPFASTSSTVSGSSAASVSKLSEAVKKIPTFYDVSGPKGPLLQPQCSLNEGRKCLVLDLDETLVHSSFHVPESHDLVVTLGLPDGSQQNIFVAKRPGVDEFLARMSELFELVIFTASLAHYADPVIDFLARGMNKHLKEPKEIKLRLYRESCLFLRGLYVKDLSRLGRKLEHTVIVDNSPASFLLQPEHGIPIKSWFSDTNDRELAILHESLLHLVDSESVSEWKSKLSSV